MGSCFSRPRRSPTPTPAPLPHEVDEGLLPVEDYWEQMDKVLKNDLLLDLILTNVLLKPSKNRNRNATFSHSEARLLRQVCHRWMLTVSSLFLRARQPLLRLRVRVCRSKQLEGLLQGFGKSSLYTSPFFGCHLTSLPPFSLSLEEASWSRRFLFKTLVVRLGGASSLVQLRIQDRFLFNDVFCPILPQNLQFRNLHTVVLEYCTKGDGDDDDVKHFPSFIAFIRDILARAVDLRHLSHKENLESCSFLPVHIIPQTVTHLQTKTIGGDVVKEIVSRMLLLQPPLLQLKSLQVQIDDLEFGEDLYKFLSGVSQSLEHLRLENTWEDDDDAIEMDMARLSMFPKLRSFRLEGPLVFLVAQTRAGEKPKCPSVQFLTLLLVESAQEPTSVSFGTMFGIRSNFPQVTHMTVTIIRACRTGLGNLFLVMGGQLRTLTIRYRDEDDDLEPQLSQDAWNAVFLGTTPEIVMQHRGRPEELKEIVNQQENVERSIRNLGSLEHLCVTGSRSNNRSKKARTELELSFQLGFLEMPKLKKLTMGGSFAVSKQFAQIWTETSGRTIENNGRVDR